MSRREEISQKLYSRPPGSSYSLLVQGTPALLRSSVVLEDELVPGDKILIFTLPDGKLLLSKVEIDSVDAHTVGRITPAHIYLDDEMNFADYLD